MALLAPVPLPKIRILSAPVSVRPQLPSVLPPLVAATRNHVLFGMVMVADPVGGGDHLGHEPPGLLEQPQAGADVGVGERLELGDVVEPGEVQRRRDLAQRGDVRVRHPPDVTHR